MLVRLAMLLDVRFGRVDDPTLGRVQAQADLAKRGVLRRQRNPHHHVDSVSYFEDRLRKDRGVSYAHPVIQLLCYREELVVCSPCLDGPVARFWALAGGDPVSPSFLEHDTLGMVLAYFVGRIAVGLVLQQQLVDELAAYGWEHADQGDCQYLRG